MWKTIRYPAANSGAYDFRGSRQISMQAWLPGSLLTKKDPAPQRDEIWNFAVPPWFLQILPADTHNRCCNVHQTSVPTCISSILLCVPDICSNAKFEIFLNLKELAADDSLSLAEKIFLWTSSQHFSCQIIYKTFINNIYCTVLTPGCQAIIFPLLYSSLYFP